MTHPTSDLIKRLRRQAGRGFLIDGEAADEIERLCAAMIETADQLRTLSMATEGHLRNRICTAANRLDAALGRQQSLHGERF